MTEPGGGVDPPVARDPLGRIGTRAGAITLTVLVAARAAVYLMLGVELVGDDRGFAARRVLLGWSAAGADFRAGRPVAGVVYDAVFALGGARPVVLFLVVSALNLVATLLLFLTLRRFVSAGTALVVVAAWTLMATHTSLVVWGATAPAVVGLIAVLLGILALEDRRWGWAAVALVVSVGSYELYAPVALVAVGLAAVRDRADRAALARTAGVGLAVVLAAAWCAAHAPVRADWRLPDPLLLWMGHFGTALFGGPEPPGVFEVGLAAAVTAGALAAVVAWVRGERGRDDGPALVVAGVAVLAVGLLVAFTLPITSFGTSDRLYAVSSIGAALVLAGVVVWALRRWPAPTMVAGTLLVATLAYGMVVSLSAWSRAGRDGAAMIEGLGRLDEAPGQVHWVVGPERPERTGVIVLQTWDGDAAFRVRYGDGGGSLRVAADPSEYVVARPGERLVLADDLVRAARG